MVMLAQVQPGEYYISVLNSRYAVSPLNFTLYYEFAELCPPSLTNSTGVASCVSARECPRLLHACACLCTHGGVYVPLSVWVVCVLTVRARVLSIGVPLLCYLPARMVDHEYAGLRWRPVTCKPRARVTATRFPSAPATTRRCRRRPTPPCATASWGGRVCTARRPRRA